jgi:hypothetical protein
MTRTRQINHAQQLSTHLRQASLLPLELFVHHDLTIYTASIPIQSAEGEAGEAAPVSKQPYLKPGDLVLGSRVFTCQHVGFQVYTVYWTVQDHWSSST